MSEFQAMNDFTVANEAVKLFASNQVRSEFIAYQSPRSVDRTLWVSAPGTTMHRAPTSTVASGDIAGKGVEAKEAGFSATVRTSSLDPLCESRTALLVRKYVGSASVEDSARFEILTQRLRKLDPRVTSEQFDALDKMMGRLEIASAEQDEFDEFLKSL